MIDWKRTSSAVLAVLLGSLTAQGQSAIPTNAALSRTYMVQVGAERGTIFTIEVDKREYWITAKHVLTGAKHPPYGEYKQPSALVSILANPASQGEQWLTERFSVVDPGKDIDIVVLVPPRVLAPNSLKIETGAKGVTLGGECSFLGFPHGEGWKASFDNGASTWFPYVKHCFVSALTGIDTKAWVLDGMNNPGFSGGPVLTGTGSDQKIFAVVSGYETELADVLPNEKALPPPKLSKKPGKTVIPKKKDAEGEQEHSAGQVPLNSGFIVAFDIQLAIDAINAHHPHAPVVVDLPPAKNP